MNELKCSNYKFDVTFSASADDSKWYHWGLIGGASLALIIAVAAVGCYCCHSSEVENLKKRLSSVKQHSSAGKDSPYTNGYSNSGYSNTDEITDFKSKQTTVSTISGETESGHASPFNKRSRRVTPSHVKLAQAWGRRSYDVNKDW